ncbi:maleylpyruvate isomerase N-terminal domain-containing protein [Haloechinothrix salitolerans]|uniref:Maleylpyruvate isomerase N-terminal domain-containing protein n=1 Tax=Haloechinothrix salitolerans TaxID=926830 RepID=A0ABW2C2U3_9PSEU
MSEQVLVDHGRMLDALRIEVDLLADASRHARGDTRVPACPGLTIEETVRHVGSVYRLVVSWLRDGKRPGEWQRDPRAGESLIGFLRGGFDELVEELADRDPYAHTSTWWPADQTVGFWLRRMLHETTIHRTDVQSAAGMALEGIADETAEDIAVDGIDEALLLWFDHRLEVLGVSGTRDGSVAVSSGGRTWFARAGPSYTEASRADTAVLDQADAVVRGEPALVYLWLWGRIATSMVTTERDDDAVAQLWALLRLATR